MCVSANGCLCVRACAVAWFALALTSGSSHALLRRHEERVDVLEALELRLVDLLDHVAATEPRGERLFSALDGMMMDNGKNKEEEVLAALGHLLIVGGELNGLIGELGVKVVQPELA